MNIDKKYYQEIYENLNNTIQDTTIDAPNKKVGKVRDAYFFDKKVARDSAVAAFSKFPLSNSFPAVRISFFCAFMDQATVSRSPKIR